MNRAVPVAGAREADRERAAGAVGPLVQALGERAVLLLVVPRVPAGVGRSTPRDAARRSARRSGLFQSPTVGWMTSIESFASHAPR
ncbi:hypothetical protein C9J85_07380 [Haloferax sp. wsp5]|nr:hypothetical protein C9J85_07380 [Haloferax sp. wsp5]